ncbi:polysaccharide deacetylase [Sphingosinicella sp. LHD-64]|uniref:polysaccharide deacetylase n=1 Tax=Sphingosinicella sp. LHD-64 TaxID=3072139 RepID=UPI00280FB85E|nr:polysaccharide deacetylase [Sphingosinicella sp. LHD-64]MDQ8756403.1 polysaccharide deacetylase [Sphingosinicella sp. LHD-64]
MAAPVLITVDTELTSRHYRPGGDWRTNFERSIEPAGVGISWQLEVLAKHGLKACFFVDPMPALLYGPEPIRRIVGPILAAGQEVQLHLHAHWQALAAGSDPVGVELTSYDRTGQRELLARARDLLMTAGAPRPIAFRGGSYAANIDTLSALAELGFAYDASHNGSHRSLSLIPLPARQIAPVRVGGIAEIPVGQLEERSGQLRHLQICAVSAAELLGALRHAAKHRHPLTTIVSHSFELASRDGLRPNRVVQRRFERLCALLAARRDLHPTMSFAELGDIDLSSAAQPMPARPLRTARRVVEQVWAGTRYERPVEAATATCGSSMHGVEMLLPLLGG